MGDFITASGVIFAVLTGWLYVQHIYREYARRHPGQGPFREEGGGCGGSCACKQGSCPVKTEPGANA